MHWSIWIILIAVVYLNIGYYLVWLTFRTAKKYIVIDHQQLIMKLSWRTLFIFPVSTLFAGGFHKNILKIRDHSFNKYKGWLPEPCFAEELTTEEISISDYRYFSLFWPLKMVWFVGIIALAITLRIGQFFVIFLRIFLKSLRFLLKKAWLFFTLPSRNLLKTPLK